MKKWVVLLLTCLLFGLLTGVLVYRLSGSNDRSISSITPTPSPDLSAQTPPLALPIANAADYQLKDDALPQFDRFVLPESTEIRAVFAGTVHHIGPVEQAGETRSLNLILSNPDTRQVASYLLPRDSEVVVALDQAVGEGEVLARTGAASQNLDCLGEANVSVTYLVDGQVIPVTERQYR